MEARPRVAEILEATTGGTRTHMRLLLSHIDRSRFEVELICADRRNPEFRADIAAFRSRGIPVHVIDMVRTVHPVRDVRSYLGLSRCLRQRRFDLVHTHSSKAGFLGRIAARRARVPAVVHTPHAFAFQDPRRRAAGRLYLAAERLAGRVTDRLICVSPSEREAALAYGVVRPERAQVVLNGVDLEEAARDGRPDVGLRRELGLDERGLVVGTVAEFRPQKGLCAWIEAAREVLARRDDVRFLIVGSGPARARVTRLVAQAGIGERCLVVQPTRPIWRYYALMDLFVLTSLWEGLPYGVIEAMACGKPVVATDVPGTRDAVRHGVSGLLVPAGDVGAVAGAIERLLDRPDERGRMGREGRVLAQRQFEIHDQVRRLEAVYAELCGGALRPPSSGR